MPGSRLIGTRIRAQRLSRGLRQADLARAVQVSPSYLNLIEHNRRNAGAELVSAIARALDVAPDTLLDGRESETIEAARAAAAAAAASAADLERIEEFIGRFPGWADVLSATQARIEELEATIVALSDRMAHDPFLPEALHEILSAVTAVQSTAVILADDEALPPEWSRKFHANLLADSGRLADGADALVSYLDASAARETGLAAPQEELEAWLERQGYHIAAAEDPAPPDLDALVQGRIELASDAARSLARAWIARAHADAQALPLAPFTAAVAEFGIAPDLLAARFDAPLDRVLRRLASLPPDPERPALGLVLCDGSGTLTLRRPIDGFALPRFGGGCPLWPLYQALRAPLRPIRAELVTTARIAHRFTAFAVAAPRGPARFDAPEVIEAAMLLTPAAAAPATPAATEVGPSCRICAAAGCPARREPSILSGAGAKP